MSSDLSETIEHVVVVGFHHARGPEVEYVYPPLSETTIDNASQEPGSSSTSTKSLSTKSTPLPIPDSWHLLPFMALPDGAHMSEEDYTYFTLRHVNTTLFGISCTRQMQSAELLNRPAEVTRSTIQKAIVVLARKPVFGPIREKLGVVTRAWFLQRDFEDREILKEFYNSLVQNFKDGVDEGELYMGMSAREILYKFKWRTLILFKALFLEKRILFYGSKTELLCTIQYSLLSLIPLLLSHLDDSGDPSLGNLTEKLKRATSLKTSDRLSLLSYMGLPLQMFCQGMFFGPYTPLQQIDMLENEGTRGYLIGTTNSLFLQRRDRHADIVVNIDDGTIDILTPALNSALAMSGADRKWIETLVTTITESWDDADKSRPRTMSFIGSEDYIRAQFEEYTLALLSSVKYDNYLQRNSIPAHEHILPEIEGNPVRDFGSIWTDAWRLTSNYAIWMSLTDQELFDIVEPRHPCSGTLTLSLEDVQIRMQQKMQDLKIDEKMVASKEALSRTWVSGSTKVRGAVGSALAGLDQYRTQRKPASLSESTVTSTTSKEPAAPSEVKESNGAKKDSFVGSWASWAAEKRKKAFQKEEPPKVERVDIGPAPARPLAQWAKRSSENSSTISPRIGGEPEPTTTEKIEPQAEKNKDGMQDVKL